MVTVTGNTLELVVANARGGSSLKEQRRFFRAVFDWIAPKRQAVTHFFPSLLFVVSFHAIGVLPESTVKKGVHRRFALVRHTL